MPNFESLRLFEQPDYRLIVKVPKNTAARELQEPDEPEAPENLEEPESA
jgi:hypothetical protein